MERPESPPGDRQAVPVLLVRVLAHRPLQEGDQMIRPKKAVICRKYARCQKCDGGLILCWHWICWLRAKGWK